MSENKFLPIVVVEPLLGIEVGTVLKFDSASGRYKCTNKEEDIAENSYYYSGSAIEIDPTIVENNICTADKNGYFEYLAEPKVEAKNVIQHIVTQEDVDANPGEDIEVGQEIEIPAEAFQVEEGTLTFECGLCHTVHPLVKMRYGLFFPVGKETKLILKCDNCGIETTVFYVVE